MVKAYILVQTDVGTASRVAREVLALPGVSKAEYVTGPYDVIVRAEASDIDGLGRDVISPIQSIDGVTRTLTCPVVHF